MTARPTTALLIVSAVLMLTACTHSAAAPAGPGPAAVDTTPASATYPPADVIDFRGTHGVSIGVTRTQLLAAHLISATPSECGSPMLNAVPYASPVFVDDRLVLLWAYPPLHTPEGIAVGTPVDRVRAAYPGVRDLTPPPGSQQYPGLLVTGSGDRAYLLLIDQGMVQKLIVGYESAATELFRTGFGSC